MFYKPRKTFDFKKRRACCCNCIAAVKWLVQLEAEGTQARVWSGTCDLQTLRIPSSSSMSPSVTFPPVESRWNSSPILPPKLPRISGIYVSTLKACVFFFQCLVRLHLALKHCYQLANELPRKYHQFWFQSTKVYSF